MGMPGIAPNAAGSITCSGMVLIHFNHWTNKQMTT